MGQLTSRLLASITLFIAVFGFSTYLQAQAQSPTSDNQNTETFQPDVHYTELKFPVTTSNKDKIEVMEVFSYGCIHCFNFEPLLQSWKAQKPDDVSFDRTPAIFNERWEVYARAYYAAKALNILDTVHQPLFDAIHQEGKQITGQNTLASFMAELGVKEQDFNKTYDSFSVSTNINQAQARQRGYRITGVPTMVVNGKYVVTARQAGSPGKVLEVVEYLIAKERAKDKVEDKASDD